MLLIVSNTGNWDHDMLGCVGTILEDDHIAAHMKLMEFIDNDQKDNEDYSETDVEYVVGIDASQKSIDDNMVNCMCSGVPVAYAKYDQDEFHVYPDIYYLMELK